MLAPVRLRRVEERMEPRKARKTRKLVVDGSPDQGFKGVLEAEIVYSTPGNRVRLGEDGRASRGAQYAEEEESQSLRRRRYIPQPRVSEAAQPRSATLGCDTTQNGYAEGVIQMVNRLYFRCKTPSAYRVDRLPTQGGAALTLGFGI